LRFINGHNKSETDEKLAIEEIDRKFFRRIYSDPRDENLIACMFATQNLTPQDHRSDLEQNHACAITKTIGRVYVALQHEGTSRLKSETCKGKARGVDRVEKFCRV
jgi:hypothetical protein